jgi:hypothetical protein
MDDAPSDRSRGRLHPLVCSAQFVQALASDPLVAGSNGPSRRIPAVENKKLAVRLADPM